MHPYGRTHCHSQHGRPTLTRVAKPPMKSWNFRAPEHVWKDALATADAAAESLPDRLREFLEWYSRQPHARDPRRPAKAVRAPKASDVADA
jgi:hypothetical protein